MTKTKKGFTLVELVIVIAVIAILAAVLIPTFAGIIERARNSTRMQKATTARDEYFSGNDEMSSAVDMSGYIIEVDEHYFVVDSNGELTETEITSQSIVNDYDEVSATEIKGAKVYKPSRIGGVVNGQFLTWDELVTQNLVVVQDNFDLTQLSIFTPNIGKTTAKTLCYISPLITSLKFGGEQAECVVSEHIGDMMSIYGDSIINFPSSTTKDVWYNKSNQCANYTIPLVNSTLEKIVLVEGVKAITIGSFINYKALKSVTLPDSILEIGQAAFYCCIGLEEVVIKDTSSLKELKMSAFAGCVELREINLPESLTVLSNGVFQGCMELTHISIPDSIVFNNLLPSFSEFNFNGTAFIFQDCIKLTTVKFPAGTTLIPNSLFYNCLSLTEIVIPSTVTSIENFAFYGCTHLANVTLPQNLESIKASAFENCTSLTSITIPESVTFIGTYSFYNTGLTEVVLSGVWKREISTDPYEEEVIVVTDSAENAQRLVVNKDSYTTYDWFK